MPLVRSTVAGCPVQLSNEHRRGIGCEVDDPTQGEQKTCRQRNSCRHNPPAPGARTRSDSGETIKGVCALDLGQNAGVQIGWRSNARQAVAQRVQTTIPGFNGFMQLGVPFTARSRQPCARMDPAIREHTRLQVRRCRHHQSSTETILQLRKTSPQPRLNRCSWPTNTVRDLIARHSVVID